MAEHPIRTGIVLLLASVFAEVLAGILIADGVRGAHVLKFIGYLSLWASFSSFAIVFVQGSLKAILAGAVAYLTPGSVSVILTAFAYPGDAIYPWIQIEWPYWMVQGVISCPNGLGCPLGV